MNRGIIADMISYLKLWLLLRYAEKLSLKAKIKDNKKTKKSYKRGDNIMHITTKTLERRNFIDEYAKKHRFLKKEKIELRLQKADDFGYIFPNNHTHYKTHIALTDKGKEFTFNFSAYLQTVMDKYPIIGRIVFDTGILGTIILVAKFLGFTVAHSW